MEEINLGFQSLFKEFENDIYSEIFLEELFERLINGRESKSECVHLSPKEGQEISQNIIEKQRRAD